MSGARFRLFYDDCDFGPDEVDVGIYEVLGLWAESSLSWKMQPSFASEAEDVVSLGCAGAVGVYVEWDITDLVQDWVSGSTSNRGVVVKAVAEVGESGRLYAAFGSRETATSTGRQPELVVSYMD